MTRTLLIAMLICIPALAFAQGLKVAFGGLAQDPNAPVEVASDTLSVNQEDGTATFTGNVLIGQGTMRLSASRVLVIYNEDNSGIDRLVATGGVTLVSQSDAAEAREADYSIASGVIVMRGDVLLTQGENTLSAGEMTVDLKSGTARMGGRVKTLIRPQKN